MKVHQQKRMGAEWLQSKALNVLNVYIIEFDFLEDFVGNKIEG